jgi:hypothetical protein
MTLNRRLVVSMEDIKSVVLECLHCGVRMTFSPDAITAPCNCPNPTCNKFWASPHYPNAVGFGMRSTPAQIKFLEAVQAVRQRDKEQKMERPNDPIGFCILMEFEEPSV